MKNYIKYLFSNFENWPWIILMLFITLGAWIQSKDTAALFMLIPTALMIYRSIKMYKEKRNGTTS